MTFLSEIASSTVFTSVFCGGDARNLQFPLAECPAFGDQNGSEFVALLTEHIHKGLLGVMLVPDEDQQSSALDGHCVLRLRSLSPRHCFAG